MTASLGLENDGGPSQGVENIAHEEDPPVGRLCSTVEDIISTVGDTIQY